MSNEEQTSNRVFERAALTVGIFAGAIAVIQYVVEADERQLSRDANFVSAINGCRDLDNSIAERLYGLDVFTRKRVLMAVFEIEQFGEQYLSVSLDETRNEFDVQLLIRDMYMRQNSNFGQRCDELFASNERDRSSKSFQHFGLSGLGRNSAD